MGIGLCLVQLLHLLLWHSFRKNIVDVADSGYGFPHLFNAIDDGQWINELR